MPDISNKKKKFIKNNFRHLSIEELACKTDLTPKVVRALINQYTAGAPWKDQSSSSKPSRDKSSVAGLPARFLVTGVIFFLVTCFIYTPTLQNDFVWDDFDYVTDNSLIHSLGTHSFYRMLTVFHSGNWHPLTWLSHAIDYALWGLNPLGHHLTNIIIHGFNTFLVFLLIVQLVLRSKEDTGGLPSPPKAPPPVLSQAMIVAGVAALVFGVHPLHVESVAWVAERKDLLCAFFVLLSILSYLTYTSSVTRSHRWIWITTCFLLFIFALMSKPMAVTLPIILLLLDLYPLRRLRVNLIKNIPVLLEKIPFFALILVSSIITIIAQRSEGALKSFEHFPVKSRIFNALYSPVFYLKKTVVPLELSPFYPYPQDVSLSDPKYITAGILLLAVTGFCLWMMKRGNYLFLAAWSYYLVTLLPVIGIIQVGVQAAADRYTYLPGISIFLLAGLGVDWGWGKISLMGFKKTLGTMLFVCVCTVTGLLGYETVSQIKLWRNPETLWSYVIGSYPKSVQLAHNNLGTFYLAQGRFDESIIQFKHAIAISPNYAMAYNNLGVVYHKLGQMEESINEYKKSILINPNDLETHYNLGLAYGKKGMLDEAIGKLKKIIATDPYYFKAYGALSIALEAKARPKDAINIYLEAIRINPDDSMAYNNLAWLYATSPEATIRDGDEAVHLATRACVLTGFKRMEALGTLAAAYAEQGSFDKAVKYQAKALELVPPQTEKKLQEKLKLYRSGRAYREQKDNKNYFK